MTFLIPKNRSPSLLLLNSSLFGDSLSYSISIVSLFTMMFIDTLGDKVEFDSVKNWLNFEPRENGVCCTIFSP